MGQYHFYSNTPWNDVVKKKDYLISEFYMLNSIDMVFYP